MALQITEFTASVIDNVRMFPVAVFPPISTQSVAVSGASAQSAVLHDATRLVRIVSDENCRIAVAANPTATAASMPMQAGVTEYFGVPGYSGFKIAAIAY